MPSLTATGWRVKWGPQCCTCNFTYFRLVSAQKSKKKKKISASFVTLHSPHNLYPSTSLSSFQWGHLCICVTGVLSSHSVQTGRWKWWVSKRWVSKGSQMYTWERLDWRTLVKESEWPEGQASRNHPAGHCVLKGLDVGAGGGNCSYRCTKVKAGVWKRGAAA